MSRKTVLGTLAVASIAVLGATGSAHAAPPGQWKQVTGVGGDDANTMRVGLARTANGVLHVLWTRDPVGGGSVLQSTVSADGRSVSGPTTVFSSTEGVNETSDIVVAPDGSLRAFFSFTNLFDDGVATSTSADGNAWSPATTGSAVGGPPKPVYAAGGLGAAVGLDGTFYSIWGDSAPGGGGYHVGGLSPSVPDSDLPDSALTSDPSVAVDSNSGQVVAAWQEIDGGENTVVMPLSPAGGPTPIPGSGSQSLHPVGLTGRIGAPGVFATYLRGTNPFLSDPCVYRVDTGKGKCLTKKDGEVIGIAAAPKGRLWVFWKVEGNGIRAARSNKTATRFGRIVAIRPPGRNPTIYSLAGEASKGPLDLLAHAEPDGGPLASWHRRVLPGLTLTASKGKKSKTVLKVSDAGAAVAGAKVKVKGTKGPKTTGGSGKVLFSLPAGKYRITVTKKGYSPYIKQVRVKK